MAKGWEVSIRVADNYTGWGSTATASARMGNYLFVDSETLGKNAVISERDNKIMPMRLSPVQTANKQQENPGGEITFQPRTDDCVNLLFSFFQMATFMMGGKSTCYGGTGGTWIFTPVGKSLSWSGVAFATSSVFPVNVLKYFGDGLTGTGDSQHYERGICSRLTIEQEPAADLTMTADMRFLQVTNEYPAGTGYKSAPNVTGSYSTKGQLLDWNATLTVGGQTYAIERIRFEFDNTITERRKLGQVGFYQFPFGRAVMSGEFDAELEDMSIFKEGTTGGTVVARWQTSDGDWLEVFCPQVFFKANDPKVSDTGPVMRTVGFRCYPTAFGGSNAVVMSVYPKYGLTGPGSASFLYFS